MDGIKFVFDEVGSPLGKRSNEIDIIKLWNSFHYYIILYYIILSLQNLTKAFWVFINFHVKNQLL